MSSKKKLTLLEYSNIHIVGIGGISMSALAEILHSRGITVTGSDWTETSVTKQLEQNGIKVFIGENAQNVQNAQLIIRTAAAKDDNVEIMYARENNIPVMERAYVCGQLMLECNQALCIAGTHGKTSTTGMATHIAMSTNPTVMIGGVLPLIDGTYRIGSKELFIMEACEYCNSFLNFLPTITVILNVEADHLDFFKDYDDVVESFKKFALLTPSDGHILINADDKGALDVAHKLGRSYKTFGLTAKNGFNAKNIQIVNGCYHFDVYNVDEFYTSIKLIVPGKHNMMNALAAIAGCYQLGISGDQANKGLSEFTGTGRRMELKGSVNNAPLYDDYAHHPTEISATLKAVRDMHFKRIICIFQPHTFTRTKALFGDFVQALQLADKVYLSDIYAAREKNTIGISSADLADKLSNCTYLKSFNEIVNAVKNDAQKGDIILTMGAGDIFKVGNELVK